MLFVAPLVYPSLSNDRSTVRHPKPSFISASATVRVPSFAACPDSRQEAQEIRPIFFVANVGNHHLYSQGCITWFAFWLLFGAFSRAPTSSPGL